MLLELGLAVGGGLLNAFAGDAEREAQEKSKQRALALLEQNITNPQELDAMLRDINRLFNSRLVNTLNTTALRSRGVANSGVLKAAAAGSIESARLGTLADTRFKALESNKQIYGQMAATEASMTPKGSFLGDLVSGTLTAIPAVVEASKMFAKPDSPNTQLNSSISGGLSSSSIPNFNQGNIDVGLNTFGQLFDNALPSFEVPQLSFMDYWKKKNG